MVEKVISLSKDEIVKSEIKAAARELFQRFGLLKTTMEDIAKASGKGKSTLYYYYKSKDEIFDAVIQENMDEVLAQVKKAVERAGTAQEKIKAFSMTKIKHLDHKAALFSIVFGEIIDNPRLIKRLKKQYQKEEITLMKEILEHGIAEGEFKPLSEPEVDMLAYVIVCSMRGLQMSLMEDNMLRKIVDTFDMISDLLVEGIKK